MLASGRRVWSPTFPCSRVRALSLVRDRGDHQVSLRARAGDSALHRGPLPVASDYQEVRMKQIRDKVGGLDIHRDSVVACTRVTMPDRSIEVAKERFPTTQAGLAELTGFLVDAGVSTVAMEATGIYWRAVYYALEGLFEELWLCNAAHVKNVPGRKTDLSDAEWLADVAAHGMVRPSFVPPPEIRELRELTRYRKLCRYRHR
jgi:transposase